MTARGGLLPVAASWSLVPPAYRAARAFATEGPDGYGGGSWRKGFVIPTSEVPGDL